MTERLRILLLNERCHRNPLAGGAEVHLFEVFGRLVEQGCEAELLCCGFDQAEARDEHRGVTITRVGSRLSYYRHVAGEVRRRANAGCIDLIVEAHNKVPFLTPLYTRVPVLVVHHHLHGIAAFGQVSLPIALGSYALEQLIPLVYRQAPIITISSSSKVDLVRRGLPESHIDVVPCGIDRALHQPADPEGRAPLVVSVGRLEPYKIIDLLIRAIAFVAKEMPDAPLKILGRGQDRMRLEALARRLDLTEAVTFPGFVDDETKVAHLQQAAALVQCSKKEGWGLTVTEANACGTPVIATDVPGLADSVQDGVTGLLVRKAAPGPLAAAMLRLLTDPAYRVRLAHRAEAWSRGFSWDAAASHIHEAALRAAHRQTTPAFVPA